MKRLALPVLAMAAAAAGCGGSAHKSPSTDTSAATTTSGAAALRAEAASAATGDIPDNQVFVAYTDPSAQYAIKYPEGWAQSGGGTSVVIRDKNNIIRIVVRKGSAGVASVTRDLRAVAGVRLVQVPQAQALPSGAAVKAVYSTQSAPNPVTGKRVTLMVDRYYIPHDGHVAIVDLGTPVGVDNVDAYRLMIQSFRWR
jgi:hypothetical protein